jgi:hypothetical protein
MHAAGLWGLAWIGFTAGGTSPGMTLETVPVTAEPQEAWEELVAESPPLEMAAWQPPSLEAHQIEVADIGTVDPAPPDASDWNLEGARQGDASGEVRRLVAQDAALAGSAARRPAGTLPGGAEFFGLRADGRRFVFVVDSSRSMRGARFAAACRELVRTIRNLQPNQFFYVMLFDEHPERMRLSRNEAPPQRPVPATRDNKTGFERWLATVELEAGTDPHEVLGWALAMQPDAVFVLSDGEFGPRAERYLQDHNWRDDAILGRVPRVVIHTVGFHPPHKGATLQRIASQYGGTYRFVPTARRR